jgi:tetratricopeptide (TPR) repeat protein
VPAFAALALAAAGPACAGRQAAWEAGKPQTTQATGDAAAQEVTDLKARSDAAWAERLDRARLEEAIKLWEKAVEIAPDPDTLQKLARGYYFLADAHIFVSDIDWNTGEMKGESTDLMLATFEKGVNAGEQALMLKSPRFAEKMRAGAKFEEAVEVIEKDAMTVAYWYATNLGKFAKFKGFTVRLFYKDRIKAIMTKCLEWDRAWFHAAPHRYFGAFYAIAPAFAGGDMVKSQKHFDESLKLAPDYFATRVLYAEEYAIKADKPELFDEQVAKVLDGDVNVLADVVPEQTFEKKKAERLKKLRASKF